MNLLTNYFGVRAFVLSESLKEKFIMLKESLKVLGFIQLTCRRPASSATDLFAMGGKGNLIYLSKGNKLAVCEPKDLNLRLCESRLQ